MTKKELVRLIETVTDKTVGKIVKSAVDKLDREITKIAISVSEVIFKKKLNSIIEEKIDRAVKKEMLMIVKELSLSPKKKIIPVQNGNSDFIKSVIQEENLENDTKVFNKSGAVWDVLNDTANDHIIGQMNEESQMSAMAGQPLNEDFKFSTQNMSELANSAQLAKEQPQFGNGEDMVINPSTGRRIDLKTVDPNVIKNLTKDYSPMLKKVEEKAKFKRPI